MKRIPSLNDIERNLSELIAEEVLLPGRGRRKARSRKQPYRKRDGQQQPQPRIACHLAGTALKIVHSS